MGERGYTLMEILLTLALVSVLALLAPSLLGGRAVRDVLYSEAQKAADTLLEARTAAMAGKSDSRHGAHFTATEYVLFQGPSYSGGDPNNVVRTLPSGVTASAISISGGGADIVFMSSKGQPVQTGSVTFSDGAGGTRTVSVTAAGLISVQ